MPSVSPMFHMDPDYNWRWYIIDVDGNLTCVSAKSFFAHADARRNYELMHRRLMH